MTEERTQVLEQLKENNARTGGVRIRERTYHVHMDGDTSVRIPKSAVTCLEIIFNTGEDEITEADMYDLMQEHTEDLTKKMDGWTVFRYYRKRLIDAGFLTME